MSDQVQRRVRQEEAPPSRGQRSMLDAATDAVRRNAPPAGAPMGLLSMASPMGPAGAQARVPAPVQGPPVAPDAAQQRAAQIHQNTLAALGSLPTIQGGVDRLRRMGSAALGGGASALGATEFGAGQFRVADMLAAQGQAAPTQAAQGQPVPAQAAQGQANPNLPTRASQPPPARPAQMTPEMQRIANQLNLAAVMEGLGPRQLSQTMGAMPARGEPMGIRDQIMADMHAAAMRDFALSQREGASQEEADAGRSQLWSRLGPIVGNNQIIPGL